MKNKFKNLLKLCEPHKIFKLDWAAYWSIDFGELFLPKLIPFSCIAAVFFDGINVLENLTKAPESNLELETEGKLLSVVAYSFPKGVKAGDNIKKVDVDDHEICSFIELEENDSVNIRFKFGTRFKKLLKKAKLNPSKLEKKRYTSDLKSVKQYFNRTMTHENIMKFVLNHIGLEEVVDKNMKSYEEFKKVFVELEWDFGAGIVYSEDNKAFSHGDIEYFGLKGAKFLPNDIDKVYYGNWLRDLSSIIVAISVEFNKYDIDVFKNKYNFGYIKEFIPLNSMTPKLLPQYVVSINTTTCIGSFLGIIGLYKSIFIWMVLIEHL